MASKRIAIIGSGPVGVETAIYARSLGHEVTIYERGDAASNLHAWGFIQLFSPWRMNTTPLGTRTMVQSGRWKAAPDAELRPTGHELRERYLIPLLEAAGLKGALKTRTRVVTVGKDDFGGSNAIDHDRRAAAPFRILLIDSHGREQVETADVIFDCSGTYGHHRWAGRGGIAALGEVSLQHRTWYTIPDVMGTDRDRFANRHTLLLGCGHSAACVLEAVEHLHQDFSQTRLTWAIRRPGQALQAMHGDTLTARRDLVLRTLRLSDYPPPWLQFLGTCVLESMRPATPGQDHAPTAAAGQPLTSVGKSGYQGQISVTLRSMQTSLSMLVDEVVALVGYIPDSAIYEQLQIHQCYATGGPIALDHPEQDECTAGGATPAKRSSMPGSPSAPEPNFFILGAKSYGTNSNFLLQIGHEQIVDAFRLLHNDPTLSLYQ